MEKRLPVEDSTVEIKADWPEASKAARRIAAHANAARGDNILWLIGADEAKGVVGASPQELANWFPAVESEFESVSPSIQTVNITYESKGVVALCFDTSRAPYLVKNPAFGKPAGGPVQFEVPWREGTKTRTATRNDLILLLSPLSKVPKCDLLLGEIAVRETEPTLYFEATLYIVPMQDAPLTFPFHRCHVELGEPGGATSEDLRIRIDSVQRRREAERNWRTSIPITTSNMVVTPSPKVQVNTGNQIMEVTGDEIVIRSAGKILVYGQASAPRAFASHELEMKIILVDAVSENQLTLIGKFIQRAQQNVWVLDPGGRSM